MLVRSIGLQYSSARALSNPIFAPRESRSGGLRGRQVWGFGRRGERALGMGTQVLCVVLRNEVRGDPRREMLRVRAFGFRLARTMVGRVRSPAAA